MFSTDNLASYDEIRTDVIEEFWKAFEPMELTLVVRQTPVREPLPDTNDECMVVNKR